MKGQEMGGVRATGGEEGARGGERRFQEVGEVGRGRSKGQEVGRVSRKVWEKEVGWKLIRLY